jgi:hypothetical protein
MMGVHEILVLSNWSVVASERLHGDALNSGRVIARLSDEIAIDLGHTRSRDNVRRPCQAV